MRTFEQKQNQSQEKLSSNPTSRSHTATTRPHYFAGLPRSVGNQAMQQMLQAHPDVLNAGLTDRASPGFEYDFSRIPIHPAALGTIQAKLAINKLGDEYEQEDERVAERVISMPPPLLQSVSACGGACAQGLKQPNQNHEYFQTKQVPTKESGHNTAPPIVHEVLSSPGKPLDTATRAFMEPRFGHDFSHVQVHTDTKAAKSARSINALAYTVGRNMVFDAGQYAPQTRTGRSLIAHELAHVVQQQQIGSSGQEDTTASSDIMNDSAIRSLETGPSQVARKENTTDNPTLIPDEDRTFPTVKVWINSFIPHENVEGPPGYECFAGDNRSFSNDIHASSRTHQEIEMEPDLTQTINWKHLGTTHEVNCATGSTLRSDTASTDELTNGPIRFGTIHSNALISFSGAASNPLVFAAPAIDFHALFEIDLLARTCNIKIDHDGFPAYEAYVTADGGAGVTVYNYDPITAGEGINALFPPMDKSANVSVLF